MVEEYKQDVIHIRIQQRNGKKTLTTVQGISEMYNLKKLLSAFKKTFACNGCLVEDESYGKVIQLQGDQRKNIFEFLKAQEIVVNESNMKIHGF